MYLELSSADQTSSKAQLVSPVIKKSPDLCMSFYYKMQGLTEGYLSVYQQIGQTTDTPIWIHWKIHSTWWEKGQVTLPAHDNYKVSDIIIGICKVLREKEQVLDVIPLENYGSAVRKYFINISGDGINISRKHFTFFSLFISKTTHRENP